MLQNQGAILMYHGVVDRVRDPEIDRWSITAEELRGHVAALTRQWEVVSLRRMCDALQTGSDIGSRWVVLSFDDAYRDVFTYARPILREFGVPWTVFAPVGLVGSGQIEPGIWSCLCCLRTRRTTITVSINGDTTHFPLGSREEKLACWYHAAQTPGVSEALLSAFGDETFELLDDWPSLHLMSWDMLRTLADEEVTIDAHGWNHRLLSSDLPEACLREEIERPYQELHRRGFDCRGFCAPYGHVAPQAVALARSAGYQAFLTSDSGVVTKTTDRFSLPRIRADLPWTELKGWLPPPSSRRRPRFQGARIPVDYHISAFTPSDLPDVAVLFQQSFQHAVPVDRIRRGLAYRYMDHPLTGYPGTSPFVARFEHAQGPIIGFFGCLPTPVRFHGQSKIAPYYGDFFVHPDHQHGRLARALLRAFQARATDLCFTASAGPVTQGLIRYYNVMPIPQFQVRWSLDVPGVKALGPMMSLLRKMFAGVWPGARALTLVPLSSITDRMVRQADLCTAGSVFCVQRTKRYLEWRLSPLIRAGTPGCAVFDLSDRGRSIGWMVVRVCEGVLEILDWFIPDAWCERALAVVGAYARSHGCQTLSGRGMQASLRHMVRTLGAVERRELLLYWTWCPEMSVYDGMDWEQAYLSVTDGDLTLPWHLDPV